MITQEQIKELAKKFQIDEFSIMREYIQLLFLKYLYEQKKSENIFFKGGTAIHLLYHSFRFSEDLDFTALEIPQKIEKLINEIMIRLEKEIGDLSLSDNASKDNSLSKTIKYQGGFKYPLTIRLDFSFREKPLTRVMSPLETAFPILPYPLVVHIDSEELMAEKVRALIMRKKGRDLFDLWFLLSKNILIREDFMDSKMNYYKKKYTVKDVITAINTFDVKEVERDLGKFLPKNYRSIIKDFKQKVLEKMNAFNKLS